LEPTLTESDKKENIQILLEKRPFHQTHPPLSSLYYRRIWEAINLSFLSMPSNFLVLHPIKPSKEVMGKAEADLYLTYQH
jgi:hypothetical protein